MQIGGTLPFAGVAGNRGQVVQCRGDAAGVTQVAQQGQTFLQQRDCARGVAPVAGECTQVRQRHRNAPRIARLALEREAFLVGCQRARPIPLLPSQRGLVVQRSRHIRRQSESTRQREAFADQPCGTFVFAAHVRENARAVQCGGTGRSQRLWGITRGRHDGVHPGHTFTQVAVQPPEPPQRTGQLQAQFDLPGFGGPAHRRGQVVVLAFELREPRCLARAEKLGRRPLGEIEHEARMSFSDGLTLGAALQAIERIRTQRLEHPEAHFFTGLPAFAAHQAVLDQGCQVGIAADCESARVSEPADEDGQRPKKRLVRGAQQVIAPIEGRLQ